MPPPIVALESIAALPSHILAGDVVLIDIDETLVHPEADATEPWLVAFCAALDQAGAPNESPIFPSGVELWQALQSVCDCAPPEGEATIAALAAVAAIEGVTCIGLTARGPEVHEETVQQLIRCGVYHGVFQTDSSLGALAPATSADTAAYVAPLTHLGGIIYCSGPRKPQGFFAFDDLQTGGVSTSSASAPPRRVVLIDDRETHVQGLHAACAQLERPFLGLHYAPSTERAHSAEATLARGWTLLAKVLAREDGRARMRRMCDMIEGKGGAAEAATRTQAARL